MHRQLQHGLVVSSVAGASTAGKSYTQVLDMMKGGGRPLTMTFATAAAAALVAADRSGEVAVTFMQPGSLGLKLSPDNKTGPCTVSVLGVNPGTQAEQHPQLYRGLVLQTVSGAPVLGRSYQDVLGMIKAGGRPLAMTFTPGDGSLPPPTSPVARGGSGRGTAAAAIVAAAAAAAAAVVDPMAHLTGKAAANALQDHIMKKGTSDVQTIARLRRASQQADASPTAHAGQASQHAQMAAAIAEADEQERHSREEALTAASPVSARLPPPANAPSATGAGPLPKPTKTKAVPPPIPKKNKSPAKPKAVSLPPSPSALAAVDDDDGLDLDDFGELDELIDAIPSSAAPTRLQTAGGSALPVEDDGDDDFLDDLDDLDQLDALEIFS